MFILKYATPIYAITSPSYSDAYVLIKFSDMHNFEILPTIHFQPLHFGYFFALKIHDARLSVIYSNF